MFRKALAILMCLEALLQPVAVFAAQVRLRRTVQIASAEADQGLGFLRAGSVVEVPDAYLVRQNGQLNYELSLNNWLRQAGRAVGGADVEDGDFYFPIKVVKAAPGSTLTRAPKLPLLSLHYLVRSGDAFVVTEDAPVHSTASLDALIRALADEAAAESHWTPIQRPSDYVSASDLPVVLPPPSSAIPVDLPPLVANHAIPVVAPPQPPAPLNLPVLVPPVPSTPTPRVADWPAAPSVPLHLPSSPSSVPPSAAMSPVLSDLRAKLAPAFGELNDRLASNHHNLAYGESHLQRICGGIPLDEFNAYVDQESDKAVIPRGLLRRLMIVESGGNCFAEGDVDGKNSSLGLFQVGTAGSKIPRCSTSQIAFIKAQTSLEPLRSQPRCLQNPVVNLSESIRVLNTKYNTLQNRMKFRTGVFNIHAVDVTGFTPRQLDRTRLDTWRIVMSAYNGGERWTMLAKHDLDEFNRVQGTHLDAGNWEDLRLFYFRRWLDRDTQKASFGKSRDGGRKQFYTLVNVAYAESILPRARR